MSERERVSERKDEIGRGGEREREEGERGRERLRERGREGRRERGGERETGREGGRGKQGNCVCMTDILGLFCHTLGLF